MGLPHLLRGNISYDVSDVSSFAWSLGYWKFWKEEDWLWKEERLWNMYQSVKKRGMVSEPPEEKGEWYLNRLRRIGVWYLNLLKRKGDSIWIKQEERGRGWYPIHLRRKGGMASEPPEEKGGGHRNHLRKGGWSGCYILLRRYWAMTYLSIPTLKSPGPKLTFCWVDMGHDVSVNLNSQSS
jgi:hypothetical protein